MPGLRRAGRDRLAWTDASGRLPLAAWWGHACQDARADVDAALGADAWDGLPACVLPECMLPECMPFECMPFECMPPGRLQSKGARPECVRADHGSNGGQLPADPDLLVAAAWSLALRRWLRRYARIGLVDLLRRPARLTLTPTHLDLAFAPTQADLRVRRAGLDIDPGWLPWYGRVVGFRYARDAGDTLPPGASWA